MGSIVVPIVAIIGIVVVEIVAMQNGIDGKVLTLSIAAIAGIGGYKIRGVKLSSLKGFISIGKFPRD